MTCVNGSPPLGLSWENVTVSDDGRAAARGIAVGVGTPQQIVALAPSIGNDDTWLFNADDCVSSSNSSCIGAKGGVYNATLSKTFVQTTKAAWNGSSQADEFAQGSYIFFNDDMYFGSNGSAYGFPLFMDQPGQGRSGSQSGLGIGPESTFLDAAVKSGSAPSKNFGLWVGSRSQDNPADGALWLGGYDTARVAGEFTNFPILNQGRCVTCVVISNLTYDAPTGPVSLFSKPGETLEVALEPFLHYMEVPSDIFANFLHASKGTVGTEPDTRGAVILPVGAELGNLSVTFSNGYSTLIPAQEFFVPPRLYDQSGVYEVSNDTYLIAEFLNSTATGSFLPSWGIPILTMNYMIMHYDNQSFSLAPAVQGPYSGSNGALVEPLCRGIAPVSTTASGPTSTANSISSPSTTAAPNKASHTNVGAIAGGVVGGIVGLAIIALLAFCLIRSRRREKALRQEQESMIADTTLYGSNKSPVTSQHIPGSPTEVSEADQRNISHWLHSQDKFTTVNSPALINISPYTPDASTMQEPQHMSSTLNQPFEMPADHQHV